MPRRKLNRDATSKSVDKNSITDNIELKDPEVLKQEHLRLQQQHLDDETRVLQVKLCIHLLLIFLKLWKSSSCLQRGFSQLLLHRGHCGGERLRSPCTLESGLHYPSQGIMLLLGLLWWISWIHWTELPIGMGKLTVFLCSVESNKKLRTTCSLLVWEEYGGGFCSFLGRLGGAWTGPLKFSELFNEVKGVGDGQCSFG